MMRPNVVVILADDLGFSDPSCFGGELRTPNLSRLADSGTRMTNFYATPRCSPSRASLLTGRHPHDVGIGVLTADDRPRGYPGTISSEVPTMAERLSDVGYTTGLSGKWHLSADSRSPNDSWPTRRGFEHFFGILAGCGSYFQPRTLRRGEESADDEVSATDFYFTDAVTEDALDFVSDARAPFFLYLAYTAPHWPLHARPADIEEQRGRFGEGWDVLRERRLTRMIELGILPEGTRPSPRDPLEPAWEQVEDADWEQRRMEVYAAQVAAMDDGIGRLLDRLDDLGARDNTLIVFLSDNGACAEPIPVAAPGGFLNADLCPPQTRAGTPVRIGNTPEIEPGPEATYASYGRAWANLSNAPLRRYKRWVHEGGIASPLIVSWPAGGVVEGGISHRPGQLVDVLPSIAEATGLALEDDIEGATLLPSWRGAEAVDERTLYWEHLGNAAVRRGRWKLVRDEGAPWELYDLEADRTELDDRAAERPDLVAELESSWRQWARRVGVIPWEDIVALYRERGLDEGAARG